MTETSEIVKSLSVSDSRVVCIMYKYSMPMYVLLTLTLTINTAGFDDRKEYWLQRKNLRVNSKASKVTLKL